MTKRVPEDQVATLRDGLSNNRAFRKHRGKLGCSVVQLLTNFIGETTSPTQALRQFDEMTGELRILLNNLACLRRDDMTAAEEQLVNALNTRDHRLPFESTSPVPTRPYVVVMLDPHRTLTMIKWITQGHWMDLNYHLDGDSTTLTTAMFNLFPTLEKYSLKRRSDDEYEGWELMSAQLDSVTSVFKEDLEKLTGLSPRRLFMGYGCYNDHLEIAPTFSADPPFGYLVKGTQDQVLSCFDRSRQPMVATWQLRLPETNDPLMKGVGFHLEEEHEAWSDEYPDHVSKSVNNGMGVIYLNDPGTAWTCHKLGEVDHSGWHNIDENDVLRFRLD
jgi:hypothetical protein